jgi:hypothetical protein
MSTVMGSSASRGNGATSVGRPEQFYPSPFFDVAQNFLPRTIKETFAWCRYYQQTNPLISAVTNKLATYPVTDLVYETDNEGVQARYKEIFETNLLIRHALVEHNLNRYTFGTCVNSLAFPFKKMVKCSSCKHEVAVKKTKYKWKNYAFHIECEKCGHQGPAKARDEYIKSIHGVRIIRWNLDALEINFNEITGQYRYFYKMPTYLKNEITLGKPDVVEQTPQEFIDAIAKKKLIMIPSSSIFHARRPSISRNPIDSGWGAPLILPVLKDIFLLQVLRKAQEAVAMEHIVPMRVMFPQITTDAGNVYAQINLQDWQKEVQGQIKKWRRDNNHIPVMPVPVGYQLIGGQGRNLMLHQEIRVFNDQIIAGMGVPTGFFYGEAQYSGASVNLRALENEFLGNIDDMMRFVNFIKDKLVAFLGLPDITLKFKPFKMADDIQRAQLDLNLNQMGKISTRTMLESRNFNYDTEVELVDKETKRTNKMQREQMVANAEAQGEATVIQNKYQIQAQRDMQEAFPQPAQGQEGAAPPGEGQPRQDQQQGGEQAQGQPADQGQQPDGPNSSSMVEMFSQAGSLVNNLKNMSEPDRYQAMAKLRSANPDLYMLVNDKLAGGGATSPLKPLPEIRAPRAAPDKAQI